MYAGRYKCGVEAVCWRWSDFGGARTPSTPTYFRPASPQICDEAGTLDPLTIAGLPAVRWHTYYTRPILHYARCSTRAERSVSHLNPRGSTYTADWVSAFVGSYDVSFLLVPHARQRIWNVDMHPRPRNRESKREGKGPSRDKQICDQADPPVITFLWRAVRLHPALQGCDTSESLLTLRKIMFSFHLFF